MENSIGHISTKQSLKGNINNTVVYEYPELEDIVIDPTFEEQNFKSDKYGYNNVKVNGIKLQNKSINIINNGNQNVNADTGYDGLNTITVNTNVQPNLQDKSIIITENGTTTISKDSGYDGLDEVEITTNVSDGGRSAVEFEFDSTQRGYSLASTYSSKLAWYLKTIQNLDITGLTDMNAMFANCQHLTTIPTINTTNVTNMSNMFYNCKSLMSIPAMNTSNVTNMSNMFYACESLTTIPQLDMTNVTSAQNMFYNCYALKTVPQLNTANVTNMNNMFYYCRALTSVSQLNTSNATTMSAMFRNCQVLTSLPTIDTTKATVMDDMFNNCLEIETITITDTPALTKISTAFYNCRKLKRINGILDITLCTTNTSLSNFLGSGVNAPTLLEEVRIKGLRNTYNFSHLPNLSHDSLVYLINNLQASTGTRILTLGATNLARLSEEEKAVATEKGWTLA